jgi:hypothetical protein
MSPIIQFLFVQFFLYKSPKHFFPLQVQIRQKSISPCKGVQWHTMSILMSSLQHITPLKPPPSPPPRARSQPPPEFPFFFLFFNMFIPFKPIFPFFYSLCLLFQLSPIPQSCFLTSAIHTTINNRTHTHNYRVSVPINYFTGLVLNCPHTAHEYQ